MGRSPSSVGVAVVLGQVWGADVRARRRTRGSGAGTCGLAAGQAQEQTPGWPGLQLRLRNPVSWRPKSCRSPPRAFLAARPLFLLAWAFGTQILRQGAQRRVPACQGALSELVARILGLRVGSWLLNSGRTESELATLAGPGRVTLFSVALGSTVTSFC